MDIKSLILIAGGVMIVAVILHGIWIAWRSRRETIRMDIIQEALPDDPEFDTRYPAELPNGGARVIGANEPMARPDKPPILMTPSGDVRTAARTRSASSVVNAELTGSAEAASAEKSPADEFLTENRNGSSRTAARTRNGYHPSGGHSTIEAAMNAVTGRNSAAAATDNGALRPRVSEVSVTAAPKAVKKRDTLRDRVDQSQATTETRSSEDGVDEATVVSIFLMAKAGATIEGQTLYNTLRDRGIRWGDMSIFHRTDPGSKLSLYSVANAVNPGTFDFARIDELRVPGVVFFMQLEGLDHPVKVFEDMRRVAQDVATVLNCEIKDENRSVVTAQTFDHYRERIAEYARRRLSRRA